MGDDGNICHHDCGAGFRGVCVSKPTKFIGYIRAAFGYQLFILIKLLKQRKLSLHPLGDSDVHVYVHVSVCVYGA